MAYLLVSLLAGWVGPLSVKVLYYLCITNTNGITESTY